MRIIEFYKVTVSIKWDYTYKSTLKENTFYIHILEKSGKQFPCFRVNWHRPSKVHNNRLIKGIMADFHYLIFLSLVYNVHCVGWKCIFIHKQLLMFYDWKWLTGNQVYWPVEKNG